jgi:hypothetical protein
MDSSCVHTEEKNMLLTWTFALTRFSVVQCTFNKDRQCTFNTDSRSRNHSCCGKARSIIYTVCVCSLSCPEHYAHAQYCHRWPGLALPHFKHYIKKGTICGEKHLLNIKCVFRFHRKVLFKTFLALRTIQRDIIIIRVQTRSCNVPVILVTI